jgi:hypothetical protein
MRILGLHDSFQRLIVYGWWGEGVIGNLANPECPIIALRAPK